MKQAIILIIGVLLLSGCAFKSLEDKCDITENGNSCTPVSKNLEYAAGLPLLEATKGSDNVLTESDKAVVVAEYQRVSRMNDIPERLISRQVKILVFPYSDGDRFYDSRNLYVTIQKSGWSKGSYVYRQDGSRIFIAEKPQVLPQELVITARELNVREGPGMNFVSVGTLKEKTTVSPSDYVNGWYKIDDGWIYSDYVSEVE